MLLLVEVNLNVRKNSEIWWLIKNSTLVERMINPLLCLVSVSHIIKRRKKQQKKNAHEYWIREMLKVCFRFHFVSKRAFHSNFLHVELWKANYDKADRILWKKVTKNEIFEFQVLGKVSFFVDGKIKLLMFEIYSARKLSEFSKFEMMMEMETRAKQNIKSKMKFHSLLSNRRQNVAKNEIKNSTHK